MTANVDERGINAGVDETTAATPGLGRVDFGLDRHSRQVRLYLGLSSPSGMLALLILYAWLA